LSFKLLDVYKLKCGVNDFLKSYKLTLADDLRSAAQSKLLYGIYSFVYGGGAKRVLQHMIEASKNGSLGCSCEMAGDLPFCVAAQARVVGTLMKKCQGI
jgi:hypothetical protein